MLQSGQDGLNSKSDSALSTKNQLVQSSRDIYKKRQNAICVSKSYKMLCAACQKFFTKIMVVEVNSGKDESTPLKALDMSILFGSSANHSCKCPFCSE